MKKIKDKFKFTKLEYLAILVLVSIVIVLGIIISTSITNKQRFNNFKDDVNAIVKIAKSAYLSISKNNEELIVNSTDNTTKGLCITLDGLKNNDFLTQEYKDWEGYIVIEKDSNDNKMYTIWLHNKDFVIDGYEADKTTKMTLKNGIEKYLDQSFSEKVKNSFTGTTNDRGGTGGESKSSVKKYEAKCINERIE